MPNLPRPLERLLILVACVAGIAPLFAGLHLPAVDAPEHLFLSHVLAALDDPASPYHATYVAPAKFTYLTLYLSLKWLGALVGPERALQVFSAASVLSMAAGTAWLARAFGKPAWIGLFALPFAFTDNFYWGLFSFHASIGPCLLTCAAFLHVLHETDDRRRLRLTIALAASLLAVQLTHAAAMVLPALALPILLLSTRSTRAGVVSALLGLVPGVATFGWWLLSSVQRDRQLGSPGEPWKAAAPLFELSAWKFNPVATRVRGFGELLANGFWDWADRWPVQLAAAVVVLLAIVGRARRDVVAVDGNPAAWRGPTRFDPRPWLLVALVGALYLALPTDIPGYMYQLHFRYAQVVVLFALVAVLSDAPPLRRLAVPIATIVALASGIQLTRLFARFDEEASRVEPVLAAIPPGARVQHLVVKTGSRVATHATYLHYAALGALRAEGVPSFSLAIDPSFPVNYAPGKKPPGPPWEWRPLEFDWDGVAAHYDVFLARGAPPPERLFGPHAAEVRVLAREGDWVLYARSPAPPEAPVSAPDPARP